MHYIRQFCILLMLLFVSIILKAQQTPIDTAQEKSEPVDTLRKIQLIRANKLNILKTDTSSLEIVTGNAQFRNQNTFFDGDSIINNSAANVIEAFGNIHIKDGDSIDIYSQYLIYYGDTRKAYLKKNVRMMDGKNTLTTEALEYDLNLKLGSYLNNGKIVTESSTLTSKKGYYYADTRDAIFVNKVELIDPQYTLATDSLLYNADMQLSTFVAPTTINDGKSIIRTSEGFYDMGAGIANFGNRSEIVDSSQSIIADFIAFDQKTGDGFAEGNFVYKDTAQGVTLLGNKGRFNRDDNTVLATEKPVLIIKQDNDSLYVRGDTLYSGIKLDTIYVKDSIDLAEDSIRNVKLHLAAQQDSITTHKDSVTVAAADSSLIAVADTVPKAVIADTTVATPPDSTAEQEKPALPRRNLVAARAKDVTNILASDIEKIPLIDSTQWRLDSTAQAQKDSIRMANRIIDRVDTIRYFQAYSNVKIFSDSLQGVCDSLYFSRVDSVFRLFKDPIVWAQQNQMLGDTIYLYTQNQKPKRIEMFENAFSIGMSNEHFFDQLKGNTINGFFEDGEINLITAKGNAESLYYLTDSDSAYTGANYAKADLINLFFQQKELSKITWLYDVDGGFYPVKEVPEERVRFKNFKWEAHRRPKTRFELFE